MPAPADSAKNPPWLGRYPLAAPEDEADLEARAAVYEFRHGLPRDQAEQQAHQSYLKDRALDAAAHHLVGIRAAHAAGADPQAARHGQQYADALRAAGHDHLGPVPGPVLDRLRAQMPDVYKFRPHPADALYARTEEEQDQDGRLRGFLERLEGLKQAARG